MVDVTADCHFQAAGQSLEDTFYLVVLILSLGLDVQVHLGGIAETLEEVVEHLGGNVADIGAPELDIPDEPGAASEV